MVVYQPTQRAATTASEATAAQRTPAVKVWALAGGLILTFIAWVLIRWITGPFFHRVPSGPSDPPVWMKANLLFWQIASPIAALSLLGIFVVRPWVRERTIGLDGRLILAFSTLWFQDPLCNFTGNWVTYNSWMLNKGSWYSSVPGSASFAAPGQMLAEPLLLIPFLYVYFFWLACVMGSWIMRWIAGRRPGAGKPTLIGACFVVILFFDFVLEGLIWMPGGAWTLAGGTDPVLFPGSYHQFTVNEWIPVSATLTAVACIRHFRDDKGRTIAERGIDELKTTPRRKLVMQTLALAGVVHVAMFTLYVAPNFVFGLHTQAWPADVRKHSYFTDYICGQGTDRICPAPAISVPPVGRAYLNQSGKLVLPKGFTTPPPAQFARN
jgi:hypothetical protein